MLSLTDTLLNGFEMMTNKLVEKLANSSIPNRERQFNQTNVEERRQTKLTLINSVAAKNSFWAPMTRTPLLHLPRRQYRQLKCPVEVS